MGNPQKICKFITKLVPRLAPEHQCTIVPKETCHLKFTTPQQVDRPLATKWCLDSTPAAPGESYDEENALAPPIGSESRKRSIAVRAPAAFQNAPSRFAPVARF